MLVVTLLCYVGFAALCLSMPRHYPDLAGGALSVGRGKVLKMLGWGALLLSLWEALRPDSQNVGFALVYWFAALMGSGFLFFFVMSYWPRLALSLAGIGVLLCPIAAFIPHLA